MAKRRVTELEGERRRLARGVVDGSIPGDLAREEHERIDREREDAHKLFEAAEAIRANVEDTLERALSLVGRCDEVYRLGGPRIRRLSNQFFFEKLLVCDDDVAGSVLREPWATFTRDDFQRRMRRNTKNPDRVLVGRGSKDDFLAPLIGQLSNRQFGQAVADLLNHLTLREREEGLGHLA